MTIEGFRASLLMYYSAEQQELVKGCSVLSTARPIALALMESTRQEASDSAGDGPCDRNGDSSKVVLLF